MDSITKMYLEKIAALEELKADLESLKHKDTLVPLFQRMLENEIGQYNIKLDRMSYKYGSVPCKLCGVYYAKEETRPFEEQQICERCIKTISGMQVSSEFEMNHGLPEGTVKQHATSEKDPLAPFKALGLVRKSGRSWLIHDTVWEHYFRPKYEK